MKNETLKYIAIGAIIVGIATAAYIFITVKSKKAKRRNISVVRA